VDIPIVINNFNRVTTTRKLVYSLKGLGYTNIHILDNTSTYPPLLEWYKWVENDVKIHYLDRNYLQNAIYDCPVRKEFVKKYPWIAYTDSDLELNPNTPSSFLEQLIGYADKYKLNKAGLALRIDDLPDSEWGDINRNWEKRFWVEELEPNIYKAQIDSTFCVIRPELPMHFEAIRVAGDFTCKHIPWYLDMKNLDEEETFYLENAHEYSTIKRFYLTL
jgi:hypothetical protein